MTYAAARRLDFIDWCLALRGEVQRADISHTFQVSEAQASADLNSFLELHPGAMEYDKSRKRYVPSAGRYRSVRGWTHAALRAMAALARSGHPMGWASA